MQINKNRLHLATKNIIHVIRCH